MARLFRGRASGPKSLGSAYEDEVSLRGQGRGGGTKAGFRNFCVIYRAPRFIRLVHPQIFPIPRNLLAPYLRFTARPRGTILTLLPALDVCFVAVHFVRTPNRAELSESVVNVVYRAHTRCVHAVSVYLTCDTRDLVHRAY